MKTYACVRTLHPLTYYPHRITAAKPWGAARKAVTAGHVIEDGVPETVLRSNAEAAISLRVIPVGVVDVTLGPPSLNSSVRVYHGGSLEKPANSLGFKRESFVTFKCWGSADFISNHPVYSGLFKQPQA